MPATFDLDTVPKSLRHATLRDLMAHIPVPIDVHTSSIDRLHVPTVSDFFGRIFLVSCNGRGAVVGRDESLVRVDHARTMMLSVVTAGTSHLQQGATVSDLRRGDVVAYSSNRLYRATFDDVSKHTYMVDYEALGLPDQETRLSWLDSKHSFSFSRHYDPANTHHGLLLVNNDDVVSPGTGFETHPHQDMEIVTWVLQGSLVHQDSTGHAGIIYPGLAQRMSAGTGILHSEKNDSWRIQGGSEHTDPVHFVQMWVVPDEGGITPGYEQLEIDDELLRGGLVPVASGMDKHRGASAIQIKNKYAALYAGRLHPGETIALPEAPFLHLFIPRGAVMLDGAGPLSTGDAVRFTATGGQQVTAIEPAEILLWEMHAALAGW